MRTTVKKTFLDIQKEEAWLNEQGEQGMMLVGYSGGTYEFEDVSPAKYHHKIDQPSYTGSKKKGYLEFLKQAGITVVAEYGGRIYMRQNAVDGPLELYTETDEVKRQLGKRYSHFIVTGISQLSLGIITLVQAWFNMQQKGAGFWIAVVICAGLTVSGVIFLVLGIRKHREYAMPKEDQTIWE